MNYFKRCIIIIFLFGFFSSANAQTWQWAKGGGGIYTDEGLNIATDPSGNVIAIGECASPSVTFGSFTLTNTPNATNAVVVKYDPSGTVLWAKNITGSTGAYGVATDASGNIYVTGDYLGYANFGTLTLNNNGNGDIYVAKYNSSGIIQWARTATGPTGDRGNDVIVSASGDVYVTGIFTSSSIIFNTDTLVNSSQGWGDIFIAKYDASGNYQWSRKAGGNLQDIAYGICTDASGNPIITGSIDSPSAAFGSTTLTNAGASDIFLAKYSTTGNLTFAYNYGGAQDDIGYGLATDATGNIFLTGSFSSSTISFGSNTLTGSPGGLSDFFLAKFDPSATTLWAKSASGNMYDIGYSITIDPFGNAYAAGSFYSDSISFAGSTLYYPPNGTDPMFIVKYNTSGNVLCYSALESGGDDYNAVASDPSGNVFIGGDFLASTFHVGTDSLQLIGGEDIFVAKYKSSCSPDGINSPEKNQEIFFYPNPSNGIFNLDLTNTNFTNSEIEIFDILGKTIFQSNINSQTSTINLSGNADGIYFYRILNENQIINSGKIILE